MKTILLLTALAALTTATPLSPRAGGPIAKPVPHSCTVINPLPHAACGTANINNYKPSSEFTKTNLLYEAYFESSLSAEATAKQCRQQCYGYGNVGQCKASFTAYNIGSDRVTGCLLFKTHLDPNDFIRTPEGTYVNATAVSIYCPGK